MNTFDALRERLDGLDAVDTHDHHRGSIDCRPMDVIEFFSSNYIWSVLNFHEAGFTEKIMKIPDLHGRYLELCRIWPAVKFTAHAKIITNTLEKAGISGGVIPENFEALSRYCSSRNPQWYQEQLKNSHVSAIITNVPGHPCYGGLSSIEDYLNGTLTFDQNVYPILSVDPLTQYSCPEHIERIEALSGMSIHTPGQAADAVCRIVDAARRKGIVGLKVLLAYFDGLELPAPAGSLLNEEWISIRDRRISDTYGKQLQAYLLRALLDYAGEIGLPVAFHTGYLQTIADDKTNVRHIIKLMREFPNTKFDVYHLSYPYFTDMLEVAKSCTNLYSNCSWATAIDPAYTIRFLQTAALSIPASHVFAFGADYVTTPEFIMANLDLTKNIVAGALAPLVEQRFFTMDEAEELSSWWLGKSAKQLYQI